MYKETMLIELKNLRLEFLQDVKHEEILIVMLRAHLYIEQELIAIIEKCLVNSKVMDVERLTFIQKLNLVYALGILDKSVHRAIAKFNNIRNGFAHTLNFQVDDLAVDSIISCLSRDKKNDMEFDLGDFQIKNQTSLIDKFRLVLSFLHAELIIERQLAYLTLREYSLQMEEEQLDQVKDVKND